MQGGVRQQSQRSRKCQEEEEKASGNVNPRRRRQLNQPPANRNMVEPSKQPRRSSLGSFQNQANHHPTRMNHIRKNAWDELGSEEEFHLNAPEIGMYDQLIEEGQSRDLLGSDEVYMEDNYHTGWSAEDSEYDTYEMDAPYGS